MNMSPAPSAPVDARALATDLAQTGSPEVVKGDLTPNTERALAFVSRVRKTASAALIFNAETAIDPTESPEQAENFLAAGEGHTTLSLVTAHDRVAGIAFLHLSMDEALAAKDRFGDPSFALASEKLVVTAWLLDAPCAEADLDPIRAAREFETAVPVPGVAGFELARDEYETGEFKTFSLQALVEKFGSSDLRSQRIEVTMPEEPGLTVHGTIYDDQLQTPMRIAFARNAMEKKWPDKELRLGAFIVSTVKHSEGSKDGQCFITGQAIGAKRASTSIARMFMMGLDIDDGTDLAATARSSRPQTSSRSSTRRTRI